MARKKATVTNAEIVAAEIEDTTESESMILCEDGETRPVAEYAEWQKEYESARDSE